MLLGISVEPYQRRLIKYKPTDRECTKTNYTTNVLFLAQLGNPAMILVFFFRSATAFIQLKILSSESLHGKDLAETIAGCAEPLEYKS